MSKFKKILYVYGSLLFVFLLALGITFSAFTDKGEILGSTFNTGSIDILFYKDVASPLDSTNLIDVLNGPNFSGIKPQWQEDYLMKLYNNGSSQLMLTSNANYETANDPDDLRQYIYAEVFQWADNNNDGQLDDGELGQSLGKKTFTKWKTEGIEIGNFNPGESRGYVIRFSTDDLSDTKQSSTAVIDFEFNAVGI
jgi:hypothetical protein